LKHLICGIDPGKSGSIAFYDFKNKTLNHLFDMPLFNDEVSPEKLSAIITTYKDCTALAVIEQNHSRPNQGVASMFKFGYVSGLAVGVCAGCGIKIHLTKPQVWKSLMGLSSDKKLSLQKAIQKFPDKQKLFARKKDDGRAEAALLAVFGERLLA